MPKRINKRMITVSIVLMITMMMSLFPMTAFAAANAIIYVPSSNQVSTWICFDGSQSTGVNPKGQTNMTGIKNYSWSFGDGTTDSGAYLNTVTHKYTSIGTFTATLTVTDYSNSTATTTAQVNVVAALPQVTVSGSTSTLINNAITSLGGQPGIVNLPARTYTITTTINVPANVVIQGVGTTTRLNSTSVANVFSASGNNVRITNLRIQGPGEANTAISISGRKNVIVDHCEISGYSIANSVGSNSSVTYEFNNIHNNPKDGLGYGIMVVSGSYAMIRKNTFTDNRHSVAGGGSGSQSGWITSYDFCQNTIGVCSISTADVTVDAHAGTQGRLRIVNNTFQNHAYSIGLRDGWGEITGNTFTNISDYICKFDVPIYSNGVTIPGAGCNNFNIANNTITNCGTYWRMLYGAGNIVLNGRNIDGIIPYTGDGILD
jgi:hypothetical protein